MPIESGITSEVRVTDAGALWTIRNFSMLEDRPGAITISRPFQMGGRWWKLQLFQSGGRGVENVDSGGHVSLYLFQTTEDEKGDPTPCFAKYALALMHPRAPKSTATATSAAPVAEKETTPGKQVNAIQPMLLKGALVSTPSTPAAEEEAKVHYICHGSTKRFSSPSEAWGFLKWFPRDQLINGPWAAKDEIQINVNVRIVLGMINGGDGFAVGESRSFDEKAAPGLMVDMKSLFESGEGANALIRCSDEPGNPIKVHRNIISARSPALEQMFKENSRRQKIGKRTFHVLNIDHIERETMYELIKYAYSGDSTSTFANIIAPAEGSIARRCTAGLCEAMKGNVPHGFGNHATDDDEHIDEKAQVSDAVGSGEGGGDQSLPAMKRRKNEETRKRIVALRRKAGGIRAHLADANCPMRDKLGPDATKIVKLLLAAGEFEIKGLKEFCANNLKRSSSNSKALALLIKYDLACLLGEDFAPGLRSHSEAGIGALTPLEQEGEYSAALPAHNPEQICHLIAAGMRAGAGMGASASIPAPAGGHTAVLSPLAAAILPSAPSATPATAVLAPAGAPPLPAAPLAR
jgi:hypothetical protein